MEANTVKVICSCGQEFTRRGFMINHLRNRYHQLRLKYPDKVDNIRCDECDKKFSTLDSYDNHLNTESHKYRNKPIICICEKMLKLAGNYNRHSKSYDHRNYFKNLDLYKDAELSKLTEYPEYDINNFN